MKQSYYWKRHIAVIDLLGGEGGKKKKRENLRCNFNELSHCSDLVSFYSLQTLICTDNRRSQSDFQAYWVQNKSICIDSTLHFAPLCRNAPNGMFIKSNTQMGHDVKDACYPESLSVNRLFFFFFFFSSRDQVCTCFHTRRLQAWICLALHSYAAWSTVMLFLLLCIVRACCACISPVLYLHYAALVLFLGTL